MEILVRSLVFLQILLHAHLPPPSSTPMGSGQRQVVTGRQESSQA